MAVLLSIAAKCKFIICMKPNSKGAKCPSLSLEKSLQAFPHSCLFQIWATVKVSLIHLHLKHASLTCHHQPCIHGIPIEYLMRLLLTKYTLFAILLYKAEKLSVRLSVCLSIWPSRRYLSSVSIDRNRTCSKWKLSLLGPQSIFL